MILLYRPSNLDPSGWCGSLPYLMTHENKFSLPKKTLTVSVNDFMLTSAGLVGQGKDVGMLQVTMSLGSYQPAQMHGLSTEECLTLES